MIKLNCIIVRVIDIKCIGFILGGIHKCEKK